MYAPNGWDGYTREWSSCAIADSVAGVSVFPIVLSHVPQSFRKHKGYYRKHWETAVR